MYANLPVQIINLPGPINTSSNFFFSMSYIRFRTTHYTLIYTTHLLCYYQNQYNLMFQYHYKNIAIICCRHAFAKIRYQATKSDIRYQTPQKNQISDITPPPPPNQISDIKVSLFHPHSIPDIKIIMQNLNAPSPPPPPPGLNPLLLAQFSACPACLLGCWLPLLGLVVCIYQCSGP